MYFNQKDFGQRIRELRRIQGKTQEELAADMNISYDHIKKIEMGIRACSIDLLLEFSTYFDVSTDYLWKVGKRSHTEIFSGSAENRRCEVPQTQPDSRGVQQKMAENAISAYTVQHSAGIYSCSKKLYCGSAWRHVSF